MQDVNTALKFETFDSPPWNIISKMVFVTTLILRLAPILKPVAGFDYRVSTSQVTVWIQIKHTNETEVQSKMIYAAIYKGIYYYLQYI